ncbi:MAG: copper resistance CopC/CopD family protein, partial [Dehalococcoidia bacterium]
MNHRWPAGRGRWSLPLLALVVLLSLTLHAGPVLAHAVLLRSDPAQNARLTAAPRRIDLSFSEPISHAFSTLSVLDSSGSHRDRHDVQFTADPTEMLVSVEALPPGFYAVRYETVSAVDGHRWQGTFPFTVLNPDGSTPAGSPRTTSGGGTSGAPPLDVALRWLLLLGLIGVAGGFGFAAFITYPAAGTFSGEDRAEGRRVARQLLGAIVPPAALVAAISNLAVLLRDAAGAGSLGAIPDLLGGTTGSNWLLREALVLSAAALAWWLAKHGAGHDGRIETSLLGAGLLAGLGGLLTMSLTSHAAAGTGSAWAIPSDFLHLTGVSLWLGGVAQIPLLLWLPASGRASPLRLFQANVLRRFATLAVSSVALIVASGSFNALVQIPTPRALTNTAYGRALIVKLVLVLPLFGLALLNGGRSARCFERLAAATDAAVEQQARRLVRSAVIESLAGALVIAVTATLVFLVPAKDVAVQARAQQPGAATTTAAAPYQRQVTVAGLTAQLTVRPDQPGANDFRVQLTGPDIDRVQRVQLRFQSAKQTGFSTVDATPVTGTPGLFTASAANLAANGGWQVTVNVRRAGHDDVDARFSVAVPNSGAGRSATAFPAHGITAGQTWLLVALLAAGLLLFVTWRSGAAGWLPRPAWWSLLGGVAAAGAVVILVIVSDTRRGAGPWGVLTSVAPNRAPGYASWQIPTPESGLMMPAVGPYGRVWVSEMSANKLAALDPATNVVREFSYPGDRSVGTMGIAVDGQNRVWLAQDGISALGEFDSKTGRYREFVTPTPNS